MRISVEPPYELQPGEAKTSYVMLANGLEQARENVVRPFFTRDWPLLGRRGTRIEGYVYTADGYIRHVMAEKPLSDNLSKAEIDAKITAQIGNS